MPTSSPTHRRPDVATRAVRLALAALITALVAAGGAVAQDAPTAPSADLTADSGGIEWLGGGPPPAPEDLARNPAAYDELLGENGLALDVEAGSVAVRGGTLHDATSLGYPVEYLVVTDRGRTHEALFVVKTLPSLLDACLRALGLRPGSPMRYRLKEVQPSQEAIDSGEESPWDPVPSSGPLVAIDVGWTDDAGLAHRTSLESLLVDASTGEPLPEEDWVYTGSGFGTLRQGRKDVQAFIADLQGDVVAIYLTGQGAALLERNSIDGVDDTRYYLDVDTMPARGTPVTMFFSRTGRAVAPPPSRAPPPVVAGETGVRLDEFLTRLVPWGFSGVVAVQRGGDVLLHKGYGLGNRETGLAIDTGSVFPLSSLSKQFTAAIILRLVADGKLGLDDIIARHLKRVPEDKAAVTVRQLLQHTSGLPEDSSPGPTSADRSAAVAAVLATPLIGTPGAAFSYSNAGYVLLAAIAEEKAGSLYRSLLAELVLGPAEMIDTGLFGDPMWDGNQIVHGYQDGAAPGRDVGTPANGALVWNKLGAGAAVGSVRDLLRWENALRDGKIIPAEQLAVMFTPGLGNYGTAWWIDPSAHGPLAWHDGILPGFRSEVRRYLDEDLLVIVAGNSELNGVASPVAAIAFGTDVPLPPDVVASAARADAESHAAAGLLAGDWVDDTTGEPLFTLRALGDDLFLAASSPAVCEQLGPALGFRAATLGERMARRGGLHFRRVVTSTPFLDQPQQWAAFEPTSCGSVVLGRVTLDAEGPTAIALASGDATVLASGAAAGSAPAGELAADAAPLLVARRMP